MLVSAGWVTSKDITTGNAQICSRADKVVITAISDDIFDFKIHTERYERVGGLIKETHGFVVPRLVLEYILKEMSNAD